MTFRQKIKEYGISFEHIPAGFNRYGHVMILRSQHQLPSILGEAAIACYPWCTAVFQHHTTRGEGRHPYLRHLAGDKNSVVQHLENKVKYTFDLSHTTFSGGNRHLRERLVQIIKDGEVLVDMFAAVGNLSMQPLVHRNIVAICIEKDPRTFSYLQKTLQLNSLPLNISVNADCRDVRPDQIQTAIRQQFFNSKPRPIQQKTANIFEVNRIFMGYHRVDESHLLTALSFVKQESYLHLHPIAKPGNWQEWQTYYEEIINRNGWGVVECSATKVKNYSPGLEHVEFILHIQKE